MLRRHLLRNLMRRETAGGGSMGRRCGTHHGFPECGKTGETDPRWDMADGVSFCTARRDLQKIMREEVLDVVGTVDCGLGLLMGVVPGSGDTVVVSGDVSRERNDGELHCRS
jgi:hypothetical protein